MLVMYRMVTDEDLAQAPAPVDEAAQSQEQVLRDAASTEGQSKTSHKPEKPEKPPPLNER
jgi:hypothetical protein